MPSASISNLWDVHVVPRLVDLSLRGPVVENLRTRACTGLHGRVLELGFGSGPNAPHYPAEVELVDAVEPSDVAWRRWERRRPPGALPVARVGLNGQRLAAADATYDAVLSTFTLCTIPDPHAALREVRRVLRPGGALLFAEHGRSSNARVRRWQRRLEPAQRRLAGGCHLTRDVPALLRQTGLAVEIEEFGLPVLAPARPWAYVFLGRATEAGRGARG